MIVVSRNCDEILCNLTSLEVWNYKLEANKTYIEM